MKRLIPLVTFAALTGAAMAVAAVLLLGGSHGNRTATTVSASTASGAGARTSSGSRREVSTSSGSALTATQVYQQDSSGVVAIRVRTASGEDSGTGIVLNDSGLILTNNHVVAEASAIVVSPGKSTSQTTSATLVGADPNSDLALIKVDPSGLGLKPLKLADSTTVQVGDPVYAIGNPYGLDETLTRGIISALGREIEAPDGAKITGAIQTDAALNPGNSGGPLIDAAGEVIGVNSQIASTQAETAGSQPGSTGVGFAISSNTATQVIKTIEAGGGTTTSTTEAGRGAVAGSSGAVEGGRTEASPYGATGGSGEAGAIGGEAGSGSSPYDEAGAGASSPYGEAAGAGNGREAGAAEAGATESGAEGYGTTGGGYEAGGGRVVIVP
jgi:putative serine protease PepD